MSDFIHFAVSMVIICRKQDMPWRGIWVFHACLYFHITMRSNGSLIYLFFLVYRIWCLSTHKISAFYVTQKVPNINISHSISQCAWCWLNGYGRCLKMLGSWVWAPVMQLTNTRWVDSACHPSEVGKMSVGVLVSCVGVATRPGLYPIAKETA